MFRVVYLPPTILLCIRLFLASLRFGLFYVTSNTGNVTIDLKLCDFDRDGFGVHPSFIERRDIHGNTKLHRWVG
jgi:hypothetical protein